MDFFNHAVDAVLKLYFALFSWAPPLVGLTVLSAAVGVGMLWVVGRTSNQARIRQVKRKVAASLLELRIFADEPAATGRALRSLFSSNLRYMGLALKPALWLAIPMAVLLVHLESFYGRAPLTPGREALVTMRMAPGWNPQSAPPRLEPPPQVQVTAPAVRALDSREVSWRLVPKSAVSGDLVFTVDGTPVRKAIEAGGRQHFVPGRGVRSTLATLWSPGEGRVASSAVEWVEIRYPDAALELFGLAVNWVIWFFLVSIVSALLLKKRLGVVI
ncbi:MAG TPA: hypothetical protein VMJ75_14875 [Candidatus Acidoferrales bacterium]|nr:hypothetical protein [Candidatus Acidoferrales bacterium]